MNPGDPERPLEPEELERLAAELARDPDAVATRRRLADSYFRRSMPEGDRETSRRKFQEHALWLIENAPGAPESARIGMFFEPNRDRLVWLEACDSWLEQIGKHPDAPEVLDRSSWPHGERRLAGDAIFKGNTILGRLALRTEDIERAKRHLLAAGRAAGSPVLGSFGPSMLLAQELLERGEKDVVLEFLELCSRFWSLGREPLRKWADAVRAGSMPDFGFHLRP